MNKHMIVMVIGFIALLLLGRLIEASAIVLLFLFCIVMMATMMFGVNHNDTPDKKKDIYVFD